jgi:type VI secretion system secreted protein VgrG
VKFVQQNRRVHIDTPLGADVVVLTAMEGEETISQLFRFQLQLLSERADITAEEMIGQNVTVSVLDPDDSIHYYNGYIRSFVNLGGGDWGTVYQAEMVPWTWFLTRRTDCRIFQRKNVQTVVTEVFKAMGFADFEFVNVRGPDNEREYIVQYRESDFDFVSRLLEEQGIFYYFRHEDGKHVMVLSDQASAYVVARHAEVSFHGKAFQEYDDDLTAWEHHYEFRSGRVSLNDFNFETPQRPVNGMQRTRLRLPQMDKFELYDYPGRFRTAADGRTLANIRMEAEEAGYEVVSGAGRCRSFHPGYTFTVKEHYQSHEAGKQYVLTSVRHRVSAGGYVTGGSEPESYSNEFRCIPASIPFRPPCVTPKSRVQGPQTATVVGPDGEEIYTDSHGRVKIQFHWDRYGKSDSDSSCWVRVSQAWAGKGWGAMFLPRIGQEVIIDFLEGDPDHPIVVGRVYNSENPPPYAPESYKNISTFKTCSSKGGEGFNELRFDDTKGSEQIFIHGEKNLDTRIKNDAFEWIGRNRHLIIQTDQLESVGNDRHTTITRHDHTKINGDLHRTVEGKEAIKVVGSRSLTVISDVIEVFQANQSTQVTGNLYVKAAQTVIEATGGLTIKCGGSSVVIDPSGVTIKGPMVVIDGGMTRINSGPGSPAMTGQAGSAVSPIAPTEPEEADQADPGAVAEVKAEQMAIQAGKYGAQPARQYTPPPPGQSTKLSWIEIELVDEQDRPIPGERYIITLPDGAEIRGSLDQNGFARVDNIEPGVCRITFPELDGMAWERRV